MAMSIDHIPIHIKRNWFTEEEEKCRGEFDLSARALEEIAAIGLRWKFFNVDLIPDVLQDPCSLFRGLRRPNFENGFCYAGRPAYSLSDEDKQIAFPDNRLFVVFVRHVDHSLVVLDWEFRECDADDINIPINANIDFEECVWSLKTRRLN